MNLAFLGLGAMGSRMARRLVAAGHLVTVYNRSAAPVAELVACGARRARTPREAVAAAEVVFSMVTDDEAVAQIWLHETDGALAGMAAGAIAVECSTLSLAGLTRIAQAATDRGLALLDAPVAGSRPHADTGQLVFLVGGENAALDRIRPLLAVMGHLVHHVGPAGQGLKLKLLVNAFFGLQAVSLGELLGAAEQLGLERARAAELLATLPVAGPSAVGLLRAMGAGNHAPQAPVAILEKDLRYLLASAEPAGAVLPATQAAQRQLTHALAAGLGGLNISSVENLFRGPAARSPEQDRATLAQLVHDWSVAMNEGDLSWIMRHIFADDAVYLPKQGPVCRGAEAIRTHWTQLLATPGLRVSFQPHLVVHSADDLAVDSGRYTVTQAATGQPVTVTGKYLVLWRRLAGEWRVVADMDTGD